MLPRIAFSFEHRADLLARVLRVPFVDDVPKGREVAVHSALVVHAVVYSDEVYAVLRKIDFRVVPDFQVILPSLDMSLTMTVPTLPASMSLSSS